MLILAMTCGKNEVVGKQKIWLAGQKGAWLDLSEKLWICDDFMKEIVTFLDGSLAGWLAGCLAGLTFVTGPC